ncbi:hypothetical protein HAX54_018666 [Datura stramonium]|uniref:RNase H type-1 domain-containing protein n=1 Tax=Datura stramonium TaxID=4076 RepID=A0ABS8S3K8_DATST|nr:hypothetical protein [Datura stramonium]
MQANVENPANNSNENVKQMSLTTETAGVFISHHENTNEEIFNAAGEQDANAVTKGFISPQKESTEEINLKDSGQNITANAMAIIEVPTVMQLDETKVKLSPPTKVLNEIVSHKIDGKMGEKKEAAEKEKEESKTMVHYLEKCQLNTVYKVVRWLKPPVGWFKCNTDGASKETDSLALVKFIEGEWKIPWSMTLEVKAIKRLMEEATVQIQHTLREGNALADYFANLDVNFAGTIQVNNNQELPTLGKEIAILEKESTPMLRITKMDLGRNTGG